MDYLVFVFIGNLTRAPNAMRKSIKQKKLHILYARFGFLSEFLNFTVYFLKPQCYVLMVTSYIGIIDDISQRQQF